MDKKIRFPELEDIQLDKEINKVMKREFPLPNQVKSSKEQAFAKIRRMEAERAAEEQTEKRYQSRRTGIFARACAGFAAAAAVFSGVCITNPAFAAQIPLVGHVFEQIGDTLGFSGDYEKYAKPLQDEEVVEVLEESGKPVGAEQTADTAYSKTDNGLTITLSEVYCNDQALYVSMILKAEEKFPEDIQNWQDGTPDISLMDGQIQFSYNDQKMHIDEASLDGRLLDESTFAGVLRYDLENSTDTTDYEAYYKKYLDFVESMGISREEMENNDEEAYARFAQALGKTPEDLTTQDIEEAAGIAVVKTEIPESFHMEISINGIKGSKADGELPEIPQDIRAVYEQKMADAGLSIKEEDYGSFTEEQMETEHELYQNMMNSYYERYPDANADPNPYMDWWIDGSWDFALDVTKDSSQTIVKEFNDVDENGLGLVSVTKTPFEIEVEDGRGEDYFMIALDADGIPMDNGKFGGKTSTLAIADHDISRIDIYICDYIEYMDEIKGYYWNDEAEKQGKSYKEILDERALYHKEVSFAE